MRCLIVATLAFCLSGCLLIPCPPVTHRSGIRESVPNPASLVGESSSSRLIHPGTARADIRSKIGKPDYEDPTGLAESYDFQTSWLYLILLVPGHGTFTPESIAEVNQRIHVRYDKDGRVIDARLFRLP
jgi:hypothetical protein